MLLPQKPLRRRPLRRWPPTRAPTATRRSTCSYAGCCARRTGHARGCWAVTTSHPSPSARAWTTCTPSAGSSPPCTQRLLVVGESGAGKTVLAIELVLQLLESPLATGRPPRTVPVRLNAARWTPGRPFESWLAEQLVQDFGLAAGDAHRLVRDRRVLPVVDGLDELDPGPPAGPPRRAMGLLAELNRYSDLSGRRAGAVVVTCRADRHAELRAAGVWLDNATVIRLHDLSVEQIAVYLKARWPDGHPCADHRDGIQAALSGPDGRAVHLALATPWRLLLTATAVESGADPYELLRVDPHADSRAGAEVIARRLLEAYVPAATRLTPRAAYGTAYQPEQVRAWLEHMAAHLRRQAGHSAGADRPPPGLTAIDLVPHLLWPIGGRFLVRALHGVCAVTLAVVAMVAFWTGSAAGDVGGDVGGAWAGAPSRRSPWRS
ncbi:NACHT domain-containing protein [Nonomuraea salmonea]|uniref:NACHT domain-containing protein n=1 Tax=Nonomuraea salmonea TaxID=46181 RepID=UPI00361F7901